MMGPIVGPPVTAVEYKITAGPRSDGTHILVSKVECLQDLLRSRLKC